MTSSTNDIVVIEVTGLVRVCAWCLSALRLAELHRLYRCSDGLCPACIERLAQEIA